MRYGIPTELTSYLVVEPGMQTGQPGVAPRRDMVTPTGAAGGVASTAPLSSRVFEAAKAAADQRAMRNTAQLDEMKRERREREQFVMGRLFTLRDGIWQDEPATPVTRMVRVAAYSDAYFALLQRLPQLKDAFALGDKVAVQGRAVRLVLDPAGEATLTVGALDSIVRDW
jgi:hypothetical protein